MAVAETDLETSRAFAATATAGQRVVAAAVVAVPFASLVGATTAVAVDLVAGVVTGALVLVGLVAYVARFLAGDDGAVAPSPARQLAALAAADPLGGRTCAVCGAWFDAVRPNQRYCGPDCRRRAAASRRRAARR